MKKINSTLHYFLFCVSSYMTVMMFLLIANSLATKIALALLALIFEMTKLTDLHKIPSAQKWKFIYGTSYTLKALLSVIASVGLVLTLLVAQDDASDAKSDVLHLEQSVIDEDVTYWEKQMDSLDETIVILKEHLLNTPDGFNITSQSFINQIESVQATQKEYHNNYQQAVQNRLSVIHKASQENKINPADMFTEIGNVFAVNPQKLKIIVFVLIMILVEISLALTSAQGDQNHQYVTSEKEKTNMMMQSDVPVAQTTDVESKLVIQGDVSADVKKKSDVIQLPVKRRKTSLEIARHQAASEQKGILLSQATLAERIGTTHAVINNEIRRYIKPLMKEQGFSTYSELIEYLKKGA